MNKSSKRNYGAVRAVRSTNLSGQEPYSSDFPAKSLTVRITIPNDISEAEEDAKLRPSVFSRLGGEAQSNPPISGTYVIFENLNSNIIEDDIKDLCTSVGEIKSISFSKVQRSALNRAEVIFARRSAALECITKFHSVKLDGLAMIVKLKGEAGKENPFNPFDLTSSKNVRVGLFGTSIPTDGEMRDSTTNSKRKQIRNEDRDTINKGLRASR